MIHLDAIVHTIRVNRMRSALTALGVVIGIAAILVMIAVAEGTNRRMKAEIESMGTNLLLVLPGAQTATGARMGSGGVTTLIYEDALAVERLESVRAAAPTVRKVVQAIYKNLNWSTSAMGTSPSFEEVRQWPVLRGRYLTQTEVDTQAKVCLLGATVVKNLFVWEDPVGQIVRLDRLPFRVIGVLEEKGLSPSGQDQDDVVIIPVKTAQRKLRGIDHIDAMLAKSESGRLSEAERDIEALLRQRHRLSSYEDNDFSIRNLTEMLAAAQSASRLLGLMLGAVASISLIVGGIGIMNIMLVSVTERTREIGIRRAIGARRSDIKAQFLAEALLLCGAGGLAGVLLGFGVERILKALTPLETYIPLWSVLLSFFFSLAVGIVFGYYPAKKAASVDPIVALKYE